MTQAKEFEQHKKQNTDLMAFGKLPPQALDLEGAILGAIMIESYVLDNVLQVIKSGATFYDTRHELIFNAMKRMHANGTKIDFMTVTQELRKSNDLENAGGSFYVTSLTRDVVSSANVMEHAGIVRQKAMLRQMISMCGDMIGKAYNDREYDCFDLIDELQAELTGITEDIDRSRIETIGSAMAVAMDEAIHNRENGINLIGYSTGFKGLDDMIGGVIPSDYLIIAAGTAEGKSTLAMNIAKHLSFSQNIPTLFFSLEMQNKQLAYKILSSCIEVPVKRLRMGQINEIKLNEAFNVKSNNGNTPLYLNDRGGMNITDMCAVIRQYVRTKGVKVVFIDYLQLVGADAPGRKTGMREQDVSYVSKQLRAIALELDISVIALSQLAELEKGATRPYKLGDLRESKAIGHDATTVLFIWKPLLPSQNRNIENVAYDKTEFLAQKDDVLIICPKNRLDSTGVLRFKDEFASSRFVEYQGEEPPPQQFTPENFRVTRPDHNPPQTDLPF